MPSLQKGRGIIVSAEERKTVLLCIVSAGMFVSVLNGGSGADCAPLSFATKCEADYKAQALSAYFVLKFLILQIF